MGKRLYVGNLSYNVTEGELREVFAEGGRNVVEVKVVMDRDTGRPRGFAFVEMGTDDEATGAISSLSGREIQGRPINVSEARERAPRSAAAVAAATAAAAVAATAAAVVAAAAAVAAVAAVAVAVAARAAAAVAVATTAKAAADHAAAAGSPGTAAAGSSVEVWEGGQPLPHSRERRGGLRGPRG